MRRFNLRLMFEVELLQTLGFQLLPAAVDLFRNGEGEEQEQREGDAVLRSQFLSQQVYDSYASQECGDRNQAQRDLATTNPQIKGSLVFLIGALETQRGHAQRLEE